ncbi:hypothetical protein C1M56_10495 [Vibrio diazotrophicus]|nr:hypothetical protein C1M56_10495 [Vibrio diazotrophicus]
MPKLLTLRTKKNLVITIHPLAENAYQFFRSQSFLFDKTKLSFSTIESLLEGHIFSATQPKKDQCLLIGGFDVIGFSLSNINFERHDLLIYEKMTDADIERFAWKSVLRTFLTSIDSHRLESIRVSLNDHAPAHIIQEVFSAKLLTQAQLANVANLSVSGLKKQKISQAASSQVHHSPPTTNRHIFERLVSEAKNESRKN